MDELPVCDVCKEVFDGELRCPRMFNCGHTFCSLCIEKLLETNSHCPNCNELIENKDLESISINYILKQMVEDYSSSNANKISDNTLEEESDSTGPYPVELLPFLSLCKSHMVPIRFRCMTCNVEICGDCIEISHPLCRILLFNEATEELQSLRKYEQIKKHFDTVNRNIQKTLDMQATLNSLKEKLDYQMKVINDASSTNALDTLEKKLNEQFDTLVDFVEDLKFYESFILQNPENKETNLFSIKQKMMAFVTSGETIFIASNKDGVKRYSKLDAAEGRFMIHFIQQEPLPPSSLCLPISSEDVVIGDIIIRLNDSSKEASKIVLLMCLFGSKGETFKGVAIWADQILNEKDGQFLYSDRLPIPSGAKWDALLKEKKKKQWKRGEVCLDIWDNDEKEFDFSIWGIDNNEGNISIPTGDVIEGSDVIEIAFQKIKFGGSKIQVINCGWVLN